MSLSVALVQMRCEKGAVAANLEAMRGTIEAARQRDVEVIVFPEMSIGGYINPARQPEFVMRMDGPEVAQFLLLTRGLTMTVLAGVVEANPEGKPWITHFAARDGEIVATYRKITIEGDEEPFFTAGNTPVTFVHGKTTCGIAVCADIGNRSLWEDLARSGASVVFHPSAPGLYGAQRTRDWEAGFSWWRAECHQKLGGYAHALGITVATATQAGRTCDEDFPGGGYIFGPDGEVRAETSDWSEGVLYGEVE